MGFKEACAELQKIFPQSVVVWLGANEGNTGRDKLRLTLGYTKLVLDNEPTRLNKLDLIRAWHSI